MSVNILYLAKNYFTSAAIEKLAGIVGENSSNVQHALDGILPSLLGGIMDKASTTGGVNEIHKLISDTNEGMVTENMPGLLSNSGQVQGLLSFGSQLLPLLFGNKVQQISDAISAQSGIKKSSAASLLSITAPILISVISKYFKSTGLGVSGLTSLLMDQKDAVLGALPTSLSSTLNFIDLGDFKGSRKKSTQNLKETKESGMPVWLLCLIGALLLLGLLWGLKTCKKEETTVLKDTAVALDSAKSSVSEIVDSTASKIDAGLAALGKFFKRKLPNGIELDIPEFGIENKLVSFIEDKNQPIDKTTWFNFDRINFETGSAKLSPESLIQTKNIAEILKAFPTASLKIGGYTDNTGDSALNLKLSQDRADAVKAAIVSEGVQPERIQAEGYGKEHPVSSNDTEEGRAQNRRIAIRVLSR